MSVDARSAAPSFCGRPQGAAYAEALRAASVPVSSHEGSGLIHGYCDMIGISPAASEKEHVEAYKLPLDYMDLIMYTGFGYPGRDILLTRCADAVICGCGRIGTIHEFTVAFEDGKPLGIFEGPWEMGAELEEILEKGHRPNAKIVTGMDPKKLLEDIIVLVKKDKIAEYKV